MHPCPGISCIKNLSIIRIINRVKFAQPEQSFSFFQSCPCFFPEIKFNPKSKVATKAINIKSCYPILHRINHCISQARVLKIQFNDIFHPTGHFKISGCSICLVILRVGFCPYMIPPGMIGHPINNYFKAHRLCPVNQIFKISGCTKFRTDRNIITAGIVTTQAPFFIFL